MLMDQHSRLYVPFSYMLLSFHDQQGLLWARIPLQQVTGAVVVRLNNGFSEAEAVYKREPQHRPDSLTRTVDWPHSPDLVRVRSLNNGYKHPRSRQH